MRCCSPLPSDRLRSSCLFLQATFTDANTLKLEDVTQTAQFYGSGQAMSEA